jgi:hypothetical protein
MAHKDLRQKRRYHNARALRQAGSTPVPLGTYRGSAACLGAQADRSTGSDRALGADRDRWSMRETRALTPVVLKTVILLNKIIIWLIRKGAARWAHPREHARPNSRRHFWDRLRGSVALGLPRKGWGQVGPRQPFLRGVGGKQRCARPERLEMTY